MGGYGSGRWGYGGKSDARPLVEDCRDLDVNRLVREGIVRPDARSSGRWVWSRQGVEVASLGYSAEAGAESGTLRLSYTVGRGESARPVEYSVPLVTTALASGGRRWWFTCMASRGGGPRCGRRVGKLYLAPGGSVFACRHCNGLAYTSSRESRKWDGLFRAVAAQAGLPVATVKRTMARDRKSDVRSARPPTPGGTSIRPTE